ncbi:YitT family protein [Xylanibacillus composti]|uniref:Membrane protein n=1 Tax=Xylanibacillus composti TaxID=1572762 RepID=A0A8J4H250_9BACL|nr:YitT family protein [Xylanibacillus composti]MDT9724960.1 YitT family protein [Xylanibacillus composti]GIQ68200.1 membrane protein [Xylanibacillus composti]
MLNKSIPSFIMILGAAILACGFNLFLIPHQMLSGGVSGVSMIIGYWSGFDIAILYFILNLPLLIWGWFVIGKLFIFYSILSVLFTSWFLEWIPVRAVAEDLLLSAVFGGVIVGIGTGISLRFGGSTGGFDILGSILTRQRDFPLGTLLSGLNGIVVIALGYMFNWNDALASMLSIYVGGKVVDTIHIRHVKVTAFIITTCKDAILAKLLQKPRGVTVVHTRGAFSHTEKDMLMTVTTRYELAELRRIIRETDPKAFVNVVPTVGVLGEFRRT